MNPATDRVQKKTFYQFLLVLILLSCFLVGTGWSDIYQFVYKWGSIGSGDGQFDYPIGVAVDTSGNVYVADTNNHRIQKLLVALGKSRKWRWWRRENRYAA